jgi:hypothetical protein
MTRFELWPGIALAGAVTVGLDVAAGRRRS